MKLFYGDYRCMELHPRKNRRPAVADRAPALVMVVQFFLETQGAPRGV